MDRKALRQFLAHLRQFWRNLFFLSWVHLLAHCAIVRPVSPVYLAHHRPKLYVPDLTLIALDPCIYCDMDRCAWHAMLIVAGWSYCQQTLSNGKTDKTLAPTFFLSCSPSIEFWRVNKYFWHFTSYRAEQNVLYQSMESKQEMPRICKSEFHIIDGD